MMKFKTAITELSDHNEFPLDPNRLAEIICNHSDIDAFKFIGVDINDKILKGTYVKTYIDDERGVPYALPQMVGKIYYARNQDECWQRFCIVKELMHVADPKCVTVSSPEHLSDLIKHLAIPQEILLTVEPSMTSTKALVDTMADWRALLVMVPEKARDKAAELFLEKHIDIKRIVEFFHIPEKYAPIITNNDAWDKIMIAWENLDKLSSIDNTQDEKEAELESKPQSCTVS